MVPCNKVLIIVAQTLKKNILGILKNTRVPLSGDPILSNTNIGITQHKHWDYPIQTLGLPKA
jgi:hypothetical protein